MPLCPFIIFSHPINSKKATLSWLLAPPCRAAPNEFREDFLLLFNLLSQHLQPLDHVFCRRGGVHIFAMAGTSNTVLFAVGWQCWYGGGTVLKEPVSVQLKRCAVLTREPTLF